MEDFASFLLARGAASHAAITAAAEAQRRSRPPIGRLALEARMLDGAQIFTVLAHQARHTPIRFGDAAVALGLLTREQVDQLLRTQRAKMPPLEELLVKAGAFDDETARALREAWDREHPPKTIASLRPPVPRARRTG